MKTIIKKFFFIGILLLSSTICFAAENLEIPVGNDYLITSDAKIIKSTVEDSKILTLSSFFTIYDEKNVLLLHPLKAGKTRFTIALKDKTINFNVTVRANKKATDGETIKKNNFEIMQLDSPPKFKGN